jgi:alanyl aminopeptidase
VNEQDEPVAAKVRALTLDAKLRTNEVLMPLASQLANRHTREAAWTWFVASYPKLLERLADEDRAFLPMVGGGFCSEADAARVQAFFAPHLGELPGAERTLQQSLESVRLCAAQVAAQRESAKAWFASK